MNLVGSDGDGFPRILGVAKGLSVSVSLFGVDLDAGALHAERGRGMAELVRPRSGSR